MQEQEPVMILADRLHWVSSALDVMSNVELQLDVTRVAGIQDAVDFLGRLAHRPHVVVITNFHAQVGRAFADLRKDATQLLVIVRSDLALGLGISHLKI
jgi:hypothetical protein